ncbi:hypothetical protein V1L54_10070 [Streptomyces sp. TRM 70361]|uniref:hypothetical protein n=1 Tax=Streptomyces sp. TRM 70361 TaxID=3116553 RepID=UPI002E7AF010|nr:hypothetical protein [Streptomyces sp. TRM 70361]MEE1939747.1 hypothetical protein [Streptomyces sp. TRM 70361]
MTATAKRHTAEVRVRPATGLRLCLATALLARFAGEGMAVAVVLLAVHRTGGSAQGAFVLTAWMAPHVLAAPLTGALAERARRPRLFHCGALGGLAAGITALAALPGRAPCRWCWPSPRSAAAAGR